jgi:hypothetical protein
MDIIVRSSNNITDYTTLDSLSDINTMILWRGHNPLRTKHGDKVYFLDGSRLIGSCLFEKSHKYYSNLDQSGNRRSGSAIEIRGPYQQIYPPLFVYESITKGSWRWRYFTPEMKLVLFGGKS